MMHVRIRRTVPTIAGSVFANSLRETSFALVALRLCPLLSQRDLLIQCQQLPGRLHFAVVLQNYLGTKDSLFERDVIK